MTPLLSKKVYGNFCLPGSRGGHPGFFFADRRHFLPPDRALFNICPYHIMNSVLISVHIHVDRNMGSLVDVLWTELWKRQGVDTQGSAGRPGALATPRASPLPIVGICEAPGDPSSVPPWGCLQGEGGGHFGREKCVPRPKIHTRDISRWCSVVFTLGRKARLRGMPGWAPPGGLRPPGHPGGLHGPLWPWGPPGERGPSQGARPWATPQRSSPKPAAQASFVQYCDILVRGRQRSKNHAL